MKKPEIARSDRTGPDHPGAALLAWVTAEFELTPVEQELAEAAAACLDHVRALREQLQADGLMTVGSMGQPKAHPALAEIRSELDTFCRLVRALELPAEEERVALRVAK